MKLIKTILCSAVLSLASIGIANAAAVTCGNASLGIQTTTVDPGLVGGTCYGGLDNLGDGALVSLLNTQLGLVAPTTTVLIDRDAANSNGGDLNITGVGGQTGSWSFTSTLWNSYDRMFLYFHFGDGRDNPSTTSTTDPDIFIVELAKADATGSWTFSGQTGMSNIALLAFDDGTVPPGGGQLPEPGTASIALLSLGIAGATSAWRRRRNRSA